MNRASMLRLVASGVVGLAAALLIAALLLSTYTSGKIRKIPLNIDKTLVASGTGAALDPASLSGERFVVDTDVPLVSQQAVTVENPANAQVVTFQVGTTVRRTDKQQDNGLLLAMVDTVTVNRTTAEAVSDDERPSGSVQKPRTIADDKPPTNIALPHEGLAYRFPFDTEKKSYPFFDPIAQKPFDANYDGEDDVNGLTTYRFTQNVGYDADGKLVEPIKYASLYDNNIDAEVTARAELWGLPGDPFEPITMSRFYAAQRTFWVDPVSGIIVRATERANHYYARDPVKPEVAVVDYTVTSTEETVESQVATARDERDWLALWSRILPIVLAATGLVTLVGGVLLGLFGMRLESAQAGPDEDSDIDLGLFGRDETGPMPAAQAPTEKIPTRRPEPPPPAR